MWSGEDRKSTRLNSSHANISYAVFCLKKKNKILLRAWRRDPELVRFLVREVTRSSHLQRRIDEIDLAFAGLERIIARVFFEGYGGHQDVHSFPTRRSSD